MIKLLDNRIQKLNFDLRKVKNYKNECCRELPDCSSCGAHFCSCEPALRNAPPVLRGCVCGTGVLLVEHHVDLIFAICDDVTVLNLGKILAAGTPDEIRAHKEVVNAYLGG